ncbi:MAG TPA: hypothetical protein VJT75_15830 [Thermoleophilaceae bacterium]|nr:hypothetical protein [Thermoleophilaceae bacterium]
MVAAATMALLATGAGPAAAADNALSVKDARRLAEKLEARQREERSLKFTSLGKPHRRSSGRIDFPYKDRSSRDVLCRAKIVVVQTSDSRHADLRDIDCEGIPSELLAYEKVTRRMRHRVREAGHDVRSSLVDYETSLSKCDDLVVPKNRRDEVDLLFDLGATRAFYSPIRGRLDDFNVALHDVNGQDPRMVRGVDAWDRTLVLYDELPNATKNPCRAVRDWAEEDYSSDSAPADFAELRVIRKQFKVQEQVLNETAGHMAADGVFPAIARAFAPRGLRKLIL